MTYYVSLTNKSGSTVIRIGLLFALLVPSVLLVLVLALLTGLDFLTCIAAVFVAMATTCAIMYIIATYIAEGIARAIVGDLYTPWGHIKFLASQIISLFKNQPEEQQNVQTRNVRVQQRDQELDANDVLTRAMNEILQYVAQNKDD